MHYTFLWFTTSLGWLSSLIVMLLLGVMVKVSGMFRSLALLICAVVLNLLIGWRTELIGLPVLPWLLFGLFWVALTVGIVAQVLAFFWPGPNPRLIGIATWAARTALGTIGVALVIGLVRSLGDWHWNWLNPVNWVQGLWYLTVVGWHWLVGLSWWTLVLFLVVGLVCAVAAWLLWKVAKTFVKVALVALAFVLLFGSFLGAGVKMSSTNPVTEAASQVSGVRHTSMIVTKPGAVTDNLKVSFSTEVVNVPKGDDVSYSWDFGDGATGSEVSAKNPTHTYAKAGTYHVAVTVNDLDNSALDSVTSDTTDVTVHSKVVKTQIKGLTVNGGSVCKAGYKCGKGKGGFGPKQLRMGNGQIPNSPREASSDAFTGQTIKNRSLVNAMLHSNNHKAVMTRHHILSDMHAAGVPQRAINRCMSSGQYWVWVAPNVASQISGTTYPVGNKVVTELGFRGVAANDAMWFCVGFDRNLIKSSVFRADCFNAHASVIMPIPAGHTVPSIACRNASKCQKFFGHKHHKPSEKGSCGSRCGHHHGCPMKPKPTGGPSKWYNCSWHKTPTTRDHKLNHTRFTQPGTDNRTSGSYTGKTKGASSKSSSSTHDKKAPPATGNNPTNDPNGGTDNTNSGDNNGTDGSGNSTGGGAIDCPFGGC